MTSPLSPEAVAQMVADLTTKAAMINMGEKIAWGSDSGVMDAAADMLTTLAAENATLRAENEELDFLRHEGGPDSVAAMEIELATLRAERDEWQLEVAMCIMACPPGKRTSPASEGVKLLRASEAAAMERVKVLEAALRGLCDLMCEAIEYDDGNSGCGRCENDCTGCIAHAALTPTADKEPS